jgi:hypothetical protein
MMDDGDDDWATLSGDDDVIHPCAGARSTRAETQASERLEQIFIAKQ